MALWGERLFGASPPWIRKQTMAYDLTLVLSRAGDEFQALWSEFEGERLHGSAEEVFVQAVEGLRRY